MLSNRIYNTFLATLAFCFTHCISSCGDMFAYQKNIYGNYYLIEGDAENDIALDYKVSEEGYVQRVPADITEYAIYKDSLIVAKSKQGHEIFYYIVDVNKDSPYAEEGTYLKGPFSKGEFNKWWKKEKGVLNFIKAK